MGPLVLRRGLAGAHPYAVKIHGSALEYTIRPDPERFLPYAREGLEGAAGVLVGSHAHGGAALGRCCRSTRERTRLGPPGVDVRPSVRRRPARHPAHLAALAAGSRARPRPAGAARPGPPEVLRALDPERDLIVSYVGKLIVSKGVDLLIAAWPLVRRRRCRRRGCAWWASAPTARPWRA